MSRHLDLKIMTDINDADEVMDWSRPSSPPDVVPWTELPTLPPVEEWPIHHSSTSARTLPCALSFGAGYVGALESSPKNDPSRNLGRPQRLQAELCHVKRPYQDSSVGFLVQFPRKSCGNKANELPSYRVFLGLPPGRFTWFIRDTNLPQGNEPASELLIKLKLDACLDICGFGLPFQGVNDEVTGWVNDDNPIQGFERLSTILRSTEFAVVVSSSKAGVQDFIASCLKASRG